MRVSFSHDAADKYKETWAEDSGIISLHLTRRPVDVINVHCDN